MTSSIMFKDTFTNSSALSSSSLWTHVFSDETIDDYDDCIRAAGWEYRNYEEKNPVVLFAHRSDLPPVGTADHLQIHNHVLMGRITLAPKGTSEEIEMLRALQDAGILRGVSVGFRPIESRPRAGSTKGGVEYLKQRLMEVSLCAIPESFSGRGRQEPWH
jgi:HK97 family phage prohead protease